MGHAIFVAVINSVDELLCVVNMEVLCNACAAAVMETALCVFIVSCTRAAHSTRVCHDIQKHAWVVDALTGARALYAQALQHTLKKNRASCSLRNSPVALLCSYFFATYDVRLPPAAYSMMRPRWLPVNMAS